MIPFIGNLLVNADCELKVIFCKFWLHQKLLNTKQKKICDFGLARGYSENDEHNVGFMTEYVSVLLLWGLFLMYNVTQFSVRLLLVGIEVLKSCWVSKTTPKLVSNFFFFSKKLFANINLLVDLWSVGCIFAEMLGGRPLFKGRDCK